MIEIHQRRSFVNLMNILVYLRHAATCRKQRGRRKGIGGTHPNKVVTLQILNDRRQSGGQASLHAFGRA